MSTAAPTTTVNVKLFRDECRGSSQFASFSRLTSWQPFVPARYFLLTRLFARLVLAPNPICRAIDRSPFPTTDVLLESVASSPTVPTTFHHAKSGSLNSNIDILRLFASFVCQQFSRIRVLVSRVRLECLELVYQGIPIFGRGSSLNVGQFVEL